MKPIIDGNFIAMLESRDLYVHRPMDGMFGGNRRSKKHGSSAEFSEYREYAEGDDLRRIDWNLFARFEKLFLKLYVDERQLHHRIYLDASASMDWGVPNKGHLALKIMAALCFLGVQAMDRVTLYVIHGEHCELLCPTVVGREAFYNAAGKLNSVRFFGESDIGKALCAEPEPGKDDGVSIVISDFLTDEDWGQGVDYLLYKGREMQLVQVLSPDEVTPDTRGKVFFLDSEAVEEEDGRNVKFEVNRFAIKAYEEALLYHQNQLRQFCQARGVGFLTFCSDESVEKILFMKATEEGLIR